jgi:hypothetical protein
VRELAADGAFDMSRPLPVRPHEFLNFYSVPFDAQATLGELSIGWDGRAVIPPSEQAEAIVELAVAISALPDPEPAVLPDVTFLVDTSSTLAPEATQRSINVLSGAATRLEGRSVALLTWDRDQVERLIRPMSPWNAADLDLMVAATQELSVEPDFDGALQQAIGVAEAQAATTGRPGVVFVITGGGTMPAESTLDRVSAARQGDAPVRVVGVGVGPARSYADDVLDELTDRSGGSYIYAPSRQLAGEIVAERFEQLTRVVARDVAIDLHFPQGVQLVAVAGGDPFAGVGSPADAQNLAADTTMVFHVYLRVAPGFDPCAGIGLRASWTGVDGGAARSWPELALEPHIVGLGPILDGSLDPSPGFQRASAVVRAAEALRGESADRIVEALASVAEASTVEGDPLRDLCSPLVLRCDALGGGCGVGCD